MARALEHLHTLTDANGVPLQVIHRDVTPQNLLIGPGGIVKLIDFGVACAAMQTYQTNVGVIKGKYAYIAPEQLDRGGDIDQRADLFSWGTVVYELLTGRPLFHGKSEIDTCDRVRAAPIADPSRVRTEIPPALANIVLTALERDPDRRWATATALAEALESAVEQCGIWPWPSHLAREVNRVCGAPRTPSLAGGAVRWSDALSANPGFLEEVHTSGSSGAAARVVRDPLLSYFLRASAVERMRSA
jgi:serine/threonine protein kinase